MNRGKKKQETIRSFISIEIDEPVRMLLSRTQKTLPGIFGNIRMIKDQSMHLTLKFLGNITPVQKQRIKKVLSDKLQKISPFTISLEGMGVFPCPRHPRVVWIGIGAGNTRIKKIVKRIEQGLIPEGFPPEKRVFVPHVTIAKIKHIHDKTGFKREIEKYRETFFAEMRVSMISFMKSTLTKQGSYYSTLEEVYLKNEKS